MDNRNKFVAPDLWKRAVASRVYLATYNLVNTLINMLYIFFFFNNLINTIIISTHQQLKSKIFNNFLLKSLLIPVCIIIKRIIIVKIEEAINLSSIIENVLHTTQSPVTQHSF